MLGTVPGTHRGARRDVEQVVALRHSKRWLAMQPFGWLCADHGKPTTEAPTGDNFLKDRAGRAGPYR